MIDQLSRPFAQRHIDLRKHWFEVLLHMLRHHRISRRQWRLEISRLNRMPLQSWPNSTEGPKML